ncbi:MAG: 50S ribosomal protein L25 [Chloroflexi bacterium]|nr:50S ribosomal protein L25 [Chloroflexota bacterium]
MPDRYSVATRSVLGKRSKRLRWDGVLPANIYGRGLDSLAVQLPRREAERLLDVHGLNALVELDIEGEGDQRPVVVRAIQRHPLTRQLQHMDFYQVDLTRPMQANVQVTLVGESSAVQIYQGIIITGADRVSVMALPAAIPTHLELSIESLHELDAHLTVGDLVTPPGVEVLTEPGIMLVRVARPRLIEALPGSAELLEGEEAAALADGEAAADGDGEGDADGEGD